MLKSLDMNDLMNLNLFEKITGVRTKYLFQYNGVLYFCVSKHMLNKALGKNAQNLKRLSEKLRKRIRIVLLPKNDKDIERFVQHIVNPVEFRNVEVKENEVIVSGGRNKAALIGRDKKRLNEMQEIIYGLLGKNFRII